MCEVIGGGMMVTKKGSQVKKEDEPKVEKKLVRGRNPHDFFKTYATNVIVDTTDLDIRLSLMNEVLEGSKERIAVCDGLVILHPQAAKLLQEQLTEAIKVFEGKDVSIINDSRRKLIKEIKDKNRFSE